MPLQLELELYYFWTFLNVFCVNWPIKMKKKLREAELTSLTFMFTTPPFIACGFQMEAIKKLSKTNEKLCRFQWYGLFSTVKVKAAFY